jgi:hypothetical protein
MDRDLAMTTPAPRRGNFVLLRADALWLLLPQHEVGAVEYLEAPPEPNSAKPGLHLQRRADGLRQLAALSSRMTLLDAFPADRMLVTALAGTPIVWCWSEVKVLIDAGVQPRSIPRVLHAPDMPMHEFVEHDAGLAFVCSAQALCAYATTRHGTMTR